MSLAGSPVCELGASAWLSPAHAVGVTPLPDMPVPCLLHMPGLILFHTKYFYITLAIQNNFKASRDVKDFSLSKTMCKGPTDEYQ